MDLDKPANLYTLACVEKTQGSVPWIRVAGGVRPMRPSYGRNYRMHSDSWMGENRSNQHMGHMMLMWAKRLNLKLADLQKTLLPTIRATEHTQL